MKTLFFATLICVLFVSAGCSSTEIKRYDDGGRIYLGVGGAFETKDNIDIWSDGSPPRHYKILAWVTDRRNDAPLPRSMFKGAVVKAVKKRGGDAAIILGERIDQLGSIMMGTTSMTTNSIVNYAGAGQHNVRSYSTGITPGISMNIRKKHSTIAIIKYVSADEVPTAPSSDS